MRPRAAALFTAGILATVTACSNGTGAARPPSPSSAAVPASSTNLSPTHSSSTTHAARTVAAGGDFCAQARKIGLRDVSVAAGTSGADRTVLLSGIDQLAGLAPAAIRSDVRFFDRFEHAILDAQKGQPAGVEKLNTPQLALAMQHVGAYLSGTCGITG